MGFIRPWIPNKALDPYFFTWLKKRNVGHHEAEKLSTVPDLMTLKRILDGARDHSQNPDSFQGLHKLS